jgi:aminoglycoside phosphotransferase (APT) family kinase protein
VPGGDRYDAGADEAVAMLADLHAIQVTAARHAETLVALGVPDRRGARLGTGVAAVADRWGADVAGLAALVGGLPARLAAVARCGLPDTLVHGDFHPGNIRADGPARVILDWGDSFVGNPAFDALRMAGWLPAPAAAAALDAWSAAWRRSVPGCDPEEALRLLRPVAPLRGAVGYAAFVAGIEPTERIYHAGDVGDCLREAVAGGAAAVPAVA